MCMCMHVQFTVWLSTCAVFTQQSSVLFPSYCPGILPQVRDHVNSIEDVQAAPKQVAPRSSTPPVLIPITWYYARANLSYQAPGPASARN